MMPQFENIRNKLINYKNIALGLFIFSIGLFKKVVIADSFAVWATNGFDKAEILTFFEAWTTSLSYTFQLYFDFSGYCDMAIGVALLFNIRLPINFNSPYKSLDIQEFWRRWHITLGKFLKDYIYIPLGGNRQGKARTYINLMITFIIGGIWHGAGWTFVFWGFLHGLALVVHRFWTSFGIKMNKILAWFITFNFINFAWIFFRAKEFDDAIKVINGMAGLSGVVVPTFFARFAFLSELGIESGAWLTAIANNDSKNLIIYLILSFVFILYFKNSIEKIVCLKFGVATSIFCGFCLALSVLSLNKISEFLYFNF